MEVRRETFEAWERQAVSSNGVPFSGLRSWRPELSPANSDNFFINPTSQGPVTGTGVPAILPCLKWQPGFTCIATVGEEKIGKEQRASPQGWCHMCDGLQPRTSHTALMTVEFTGKDNSKLIFVCVFSKIRKSWRCRKLH